MVAVEQLLNSSAKLFIPSFLSRPNGTFKPNLYATGSLSVSVSFRDEDETVRPSPTKQVISKVSGESEPYRYRGEVDSGAHACSTTDICLKNYTYTSYSDRSVRP